MHPQKRWYDHKCTKGRRVSLLQRAISKYGKDKFFFDVVSTNLTLVEATQLEMRLIALYNADNLKFGYNIAKGGRVYAGRKLSAETKAKISKANMGKKPSDDVKKKISNAVKYSYTSGKRGLESATKAASRFGTANRSKPIQCLETCQVFSSIKEAAAHLCINYNKIRDFFAGKCRSADSYTFIFCPKNPA